MRTTILLVSLLAHICASIGQGDVPVVRTLDQELQEKSSFLHTEYLVFLPKDLSDTKLPLLIYLHGAGGRGNNIAKVRGQAMGVWHGTQRFVSAPCILVAPQCLASTKKSLHSTWVPDDLNILLQHLKETLPVDSDRVYLTGNSMGGYGTWVWGAHNPEHFAAIAPVSGGTGRRGPKDVTPDIAIWAQNLAKVPVYAFAGAKDKVVPSDRSESLVAAIRAAEGKQATLKIYPDEGHGARRVVYSTEELYDWMFSKARNPADPTMLTRETEQ